MLVGCQNSETVGALLNAHVGKEQARLLDSRTLDLAGGLFNPEAYITATRQYVAQANGWSLEELALSVHVRTGPVEQKPQLDECSFAISALKLQGAECTKDSKLMLSTNILSDLPLTVLSWKK